LNSLQTVLWYFLVYACLGWMTEVCYAAATKGKIVNRGFLNGPVCPIYGVGMVVVIACLTPLQENKPLFFLGAVALTTLIEGLTGFLLEKLFHQRWWDYSNVPFNLGGYVCPKFSIAWGLGCILVLDVVHAPVKRLVAALQSPPGTVLLCALLAVFAADAVATVRTLIHLNRRLGEIDEVAGRLREVSDRMTETLSSSTFAAMDRGAELEQQRRQLVDLAERIGILLRANALEHADEVKQRAEETSEALQTLRETLAGTLEQERLELLQRQQERLTALIDRQSELLERTQSGVGRLLRAFSDARSTAHEEAMRALRRRL